MKIENQNLNIEKWANTFNIVLCNVCKKEKATCMNNTVCPNCVKVLIKNLAGGSKRILPE